MWKIKTSNGYIFVHNYSVVNMCFQNFCLFSEEVRSTIVNSCYPGLSVSIWQSMGYKSYLVRPLGVIEAVTYCWFSAKIPRIHFQFLLHEVHPFSIYMVEGNRTQLNTLAQLIDSNPLFYSTWSSSKLICDVRYAMHAL